MSFLRLPDTTHIGHVHLKVTDLNRSLAFYGDLLGLQEVGRDGQTAFLAARSDGPVLVVLTQWPEARPKPPNTTGLYHVAIRLPNRHELARTFKRLLDHQWPFHGFSDHKVSEALYLADPDGNGLELYRDRPREQWPWRNGQVAMHTDPLDVQGLLAEIAGEAESWSGIHPNTDIGHVHLHVADLNEAEAFYHGLLGFDVTQRDYPGARFFAAGGYHHHLGTNIWAGVGAPPPPPNAVGLHHFSVCLEDQAAFERLAHRLQEAGVQVARQKGFFRVEDPFGNSIVVTVTEAGLPECSHI